MQTVSEFFRGEGVARRFANRLLRQILVGAMLIGIAPFFCAEAVHAGAASTKPKMVKVWKFVQRSTHGHGVALVSDSAVKLTFSDQNVYWVASAPTWDVCVLNYKLNLGTKRPLSFAVGRADNSVEFGKITGF